MLQVRTFTRRLSLNPQATQTEPHQDFPIPPGHPLLCPTCPPRGPYRKLFPKGQAGLNNTVGHCQDRELEAATSSLLLKNHTLNVTHIHCGSGPGAPRQPEARSQPCSVSLHGRARANGPVLWKPRRHT